MSHSYRTYVQLHSLVDSPQRSCALVPGQATLVPGTLWGVVREILGSVLSDQKPWQTTQGLGF